MGSSAFIAKVEIEKLQFIFTFMKGFDVLRIIDFALKQRTKQLT